MRVHQPGSAPDARRPAAVEDWSWAQTRRRLHALYPLARPYKARTLLAILSLLGATVVALAPPYLVGRAVDEVQHGETALLGRLVVAFVAAGLLGIVVHATRRRTSPAGRASGCSPTCATISSATCSASRSASTSATAPA